MCLCVSCPGGLVHTNGAKHMVQCTGYAARLSIHADVVSLLHASRICQAIKLRMDH